MPWYHRRWIPQPMEEAICMYALPPAASTRVLPKQPHRYLCPPWASMALHYTASLASMQAEAGKLMKWDKKKAKWQCPCLESKNQVKMVKIQ